MNIKPSREAGMSRRQVLQAGLATAAAVAMGSPAEAMTKDQPARAPDARVIDIHAHYFPEAYLDLVATEEGFGRDERVARTLGVGVVAAVDDGHLALEEIAGPLDPPGDDPGVSSAGPLEVAIEPKEGRQDRLANLLLAVGVEALELLLERLAGVRLAPIEQELLSLKADVKTDEKTRVQFSGVLGGIVNLFGGKAAREGVTNVVAVKGDRKATTTDSAGRIVDLTEEKIYDLDIRRKN